MTAGAGKSRTRVRRGVSLIAGLIILAGLRSAVFPSSPRQETPPQVPSVRVIEERTSPFNISAHVFILGNMGDIGTMTIESALREKGDRLEKSLRVYGSSNEETRKKYDYRGQADILKVLPLRADGSVDEEAVRDWRDYESSASSSLKLNRKFQSEKIDFFRDHIVSTREDGKVRETAGSYGSFLSPLEYLMEHDIKVGEVIETPYVLNGVPRIFRSEVTDLVTLSDFHARAYQIDISSYDKVKAEDKGSRDVWKKKGNIRVWFCKNEPYRNEILRMKIKFRWYLWLYFDLKK
ncbi:MAG: hypothetical protein ABSG19_01580 [Candidatus Aminicenantales bacterium]